jgi:hypothetical protein
MMTTSGGDNEADDNGARYPVVRTRYDEDRKPVPRMWILRRDNYRCVICGSSARLEIDHIVPWSAGGSDHPDNLRTLCHWCNTDRSNFRIPADSCRRIPNGLECVHCAPHLIGEPDVIPIYCAMCGRKAPGIPTNPQDDQHRDGAVNDDGPAYDEARLRAEVVRRIRESSPPASMPDEPCDA